jgi:hypothetical protein
LDFGAFVFLAAGSCSSYITGEVLPIIGGYSGEAFESFPSNKPDAAVRQLNGRAGEVWGAESATDRLVVIAQLATNQAT